MSDADKRLRAVGVPVSTCALLDAYVAQHPLRPSRARVVDLAVKEFLERERRAGASTPSAIGGR